MGRTQIAKASIAQLKVQVKQAHERKKHLQEYLKNLEKAHYEKRISYAQYVETLHKKTDGRNLHELIHHYDHHIKECEKLISNPFFRRNLRQNLRDRRLYQSRQISLDDQTSVWPR